MAVYTEIAASDMEAFLTGYDIGSLLSYKGIAEGVENSNFLLRTDKGTYILTLYEKRVDAGDLPFFIGLMDHLAKKEVSCPLPIRNNKGEALGTLSDRPAAIVSFLEGMWVRRPQTNHCQLLGAAMANMHEAAKDFEIKRPNALSVSDWRPLFELSKDRANEVKSDLAERISSELDFLEGNWPKGLPSGVIHADLFPDNVFFLREDLSGLIDFYFACNDQFAYDLAICLNAWCFEADNAFNVTKAKALVAGYESVRPLSDDERAALPILARGAALRFLLTRLYDWLQVPQGAMVTPKNPREYIEKLAFHQSVASAADYGLTGA